jgi:hypothetical protein
MAFSKLPVNYQMVDWTADTPSEEKLPAEC